VAVIPSGGEKSAFVLNIAGEKHILTALGMTSSNHFSTT